MRHQQEPAQSQSGHWSAQHWVHVRTPMVVSCHLWPSVHRSITNCANYCEDSVVYLFILVFFGSKVVRQSVESDTFMWKCVTQPV